eukprot:NODE_558_length_6689_cov_0.361912.p2 type:complete len:604 gc:universal NODE_558_length_6689_cov_0.361912:6568-4757(-)
MQSICEYYEYRKMPNSLPDLIKKPFYSLLYIEKSHILYSRAVGIYLLQELSKSNPTSPIEIKATAFMRKHLSLLTVQTSNWITAILSNGLQTFNTNIPGFKLHVVGICHFKSACLNGAIPELLNTFDEAMAASVLLNISDSVFSNFISNLEHLIKIILDTRSSIDVVVNDPKIEQYAPNCFSKVAEYGSSLSIIFGKETSPYNKLPFILKICEYLSMHILSVHEKEFIKCVPLLERLLNTCQDDLYIPKNKTLLKSYLGVGKLRFTELFGQMIMPLIESWLISFNNAEELIKLFGLTDLDALETYMIEWQDTLMALNVIDIQYGEFIANLAEHLKLSYANKDRKELLKQVSMMFKTPPTAYRITDHDRMFIRRVFPKSHAIREFRNYTRATLEAYSEYEQTINDDVYELPDIIISGQAKTVVSVCHELMKQYCADPVANNQSPHHCKDLLNSIRNLLYNRKHIINLTSACVAYNDTTIYFMHHLLLLQKMLTDGQSNCMENEFLLTFVDLEHLFMVKGSKLLHDELNKTLEAIDMNNTNGALIDLKNVWDILTEYLSEHDLHKIKTRVTRFLELKNEKFLNTMNDYMSSKFKSEFYRRYMANK